MSDAYKAYITQAERDKIPAEDFAGPDRTFPIRNQQDVMDAAKLIGHADDPAEVKRKIIAIAKRKGLDIPDAWQMDGGCKADSDFMHYPYAGAVKATGNGKIRVTLVRFSHEDDHDSDGEFFDARTDFDTDFPAKRSLWYHHGQDEEIGDRRLGRVEIKQSSAELWFEHQLNLSDEYESKMYRLAEMGRLGASSGAVPHLVRRSYTGKATHIDRWPLAEASLLVTMADPSARAVAVKSWTPTPIDEALKADLLPPSLNEDLERLTDAAENVRDRISGIAAKAGRKLSGAKRQRLADAIDALTALLVETDPASPGDANAASRPGELPTADEAEKSAPDDEAETLWLAFQVAQNGVSVPLGASPCP